MIIEDRMDTIFTIDMSTGDNILPFDLLLERATDYIGGLFAPHFPLPAIYHEPQYEFVCSLARQGCDYPCPLFGWLTQHCLNPDCCFA